MRGRPSGTPRKSLTFLQPLRDHSGGSSTQATCLSCAIKGSSAWLHAIQAGSGSGVGRQAGAEGDVSLFGRVDDDVVGRRA
jgi:hypothetical protein